MLNEKDIYSHIANGGDPKELYKALENEIHNAQDRIIKEKDAELKKQEQAKKISKARDAAFKAIKTYVALVNPELDDAFINSALDICESFKSIPCKGFKTAPCSRDAQTPDWILDMFNRLF